MLSVRNVSYRYDRKKPAWVLKDLSVDFEEGKFYMITGSSGAGKTTCLCLLGGLDRPEEGEISFGGDSIGKIGYDRIRRGTAGYIFQDFHLFGHMNAIDNIVTAMQISDPETGYREAAEKAAEILMAVGIEAKDHKRKVTQLSGGQQQRVAIARAVATDTKYIIADEPTGNLDSETAEKILELLRRLVKENGKCVIMATHALHYLKYADECLEISEGRLVRRVLPES